jgi:hypothetical protein
MTELAQSEKNLLTQQELIQGSYEDMLKYGFHYIMDIKDKGTYVDDFEKELHREQALLGRFESLLNKEEFQEPGTAGAELPERGIFKQLLGLFEEDIRLLDGLIRSFNMLQNMENGEVPTYLTIKKELVQDTTRGYRYKYTVTNAADGVDLKDVEVTDSSLGVIKTQTGEEKFSLNNGTTVEIFSDYQHFDCNTCPGCVCRWCNFAIAMGYQVTDSKVVYSLSNYVCHSSSGDDTGETQTLHGELTQALPCCEYVLLPDTGGKCWLIVEESNSEVKAKLDQILRYCEKVKNTPLIEATGTYYESYENECGWKDPVLIVKDVHYAVEIVKSADPIEVKVGDKVNYKATVHNYWNKKFINGEVDDFNCGETSAQQHFNIADIAPESDLSEPVTWSETYAQEGKYCDFVNVKGEVETSAGSAGVLWDSNEVTVTVTGGAAPTHVQMKFWESYLDLLTDEMRAGTEAEPPLLPWTFVIAYNPDPEADIHSRVYQNQAAGVEIAHLAGKDFDSITNDDVVGAPWTPELVDEPFDSSRVVLLRQDSRIFKLGNPVEDESSVAFDYEELPA